MATSEINEKDVLLSEERMGDPSRVQAILAEWGLDEASINRMLSEHNVAEALSGNAQASGSKRRSPDATIRSSNRGAGLHA